MSAAERTGKHYGWSKGIHGWFKDMRNQVTIGRFVGGSLLCMVMAIFMTGCASSGNTAKGDHDYVKAYESGRYAQAYEDSAAAAARTSGFQHDQAALIAGLSAHALNRNDEAEKQLSPLVAGSDSKVAGEAGATLGLIAAERGRHDKAVGFLSDAGKKLQGDQAARAFMYAGDSYKSMSRDADARGMWSLAQTKVTNDSSLKVMIGDRLKGPTAPVTPTPQAQAKGTKYTVQVGAFSSYTNAQRQLSRFKAYGTPRVVETNKNGKKLFVVRIGSYATKTQADKVAKSVGSTARAMVQDD